MSIPMKIYWDRTTNALRNSAGEEINKEELLPDAMLGQKKWINLKVVTNSSLSAYTSYPLATSGLVFVDNDYDNTPPILPLEGGNDNWTAGTGSEYYYTVPLSSQPASVWFNDIAAVLGTVGALSAGEYGWDSTNSRLYVRLADSTDPDTKAEGWVEIKYSGTGTPGFIEVDSATFNQANSWYDTAESGDYRNPDITDGEISFEINANTVRFFDRIGDDEKATGTTMQIQLIDGSGYFFELIEFDFVCQNRYLGIDSVGLELSTGNFYTKAEINAFELLKADKVIGAVAGNIASLDANGNLVDSGVAVVGISTDIYVKASASDPSAGYLDAKVDNVTIQITAEKLTVKAITASLVTDFEATVTANAAVTLNTTHRSLTNNPHSVTATQVNLGSVTDNKQIKAIATATLDTKIVVWDGDTGDAVKATLVTIDGTGNINVPTGATFKVNNVAIGIMTQAEADELVGGGETDLHSHDTANLTEHGIDSSAYSHTSADADKILTFQYSEIDQTATGYVLLLHGNGEDGSTSFPDRSPEAHTVTAHGDAQVDTAQKALGSGSIYLPQSSAGDYLSIPDDASFVFGTDDFRIDARIRFANSPTDSGDLPQYIIGQESADTSSKGWKLFFDPVDGLCFSYATQAGNWTTEINGNWSPSINTWYEVTVIRAGNEIQLYVDGSALMSTSYDCTGNDLADSSGDVWIGASPVSGGSEFFDGWIDEMYIDTNSQSIDDFVPATIEEFVTQKYDMSDNVLGELIIDESETLTDNAQNDIVLGALATYRAFHVTGIIDDGVNYALFEGYIIHNGATATWYGPGFIAGGASFTTVTFNASINGANVELNITVTAHGSNPKMIYKIDKKYEVSV